MSEPIKTIHKQRAAKIKFIGANFIDQINAKCNKELQAHGAIKKLSKKLKKLGYQ
jgi:hypothetical protein